METTTLVPACPYCRSTTTDLEWEDRDRWYGFPGAFQWARCRDCGVCWLKVRPSRDALGQYYPSDDYYSYQAPIDLPGDELLSRKGVIAAVKRAARRTSLAVAGYGSLPSSRVRRAFAKAVARTAGYRALYGYRGFPQAVLHGKALDLGCGSGLFLRYLRAHGWEVHGLDLSETAAIGARRHGIPVHVGTIESAPWEPETFDFICMSHVLEHLWDPMGGLRRCARLLQPGGRLYVETPNPESSNAKRFGTHWYPWETPRHLALFTPQTLAGALEEVGLKVETLTTFRFPRVDQFADTYRQEDRAAVVLDRPSIRALAVPRALAERALTAMSGTLASGRHDLIGCWAERPPL